MKFKVLVTSKIASSGIELLKSNNCEIVNEIGSEIDNVADHIGDCDAVITRTQKIDEKVYKAGRKLKVVGKHGVGVDCIDVKAATRRGIQVVNAPESNNDSVVEHALTFFLALTRKIRVCHDAVVTGNFQSRELIEIHQLKGKVLGIVGLGRIGIKVGLRAAAAFEMKVVAFDPYVHKDFHLNKIEILDSLDDLLNQSDIVSLHVPLTDQTYHMIDIQQLKRMKKTAFLVNLARGPVVNQESLCRALKDSEIAGAGLDVFEQEPPPPESDLFTIENVILSPHNAALTVEARGNMALHSAMGVIDVLKGKRPTWPVNQLS